MNNRTLNRLLLALIGLTAAALLWNRYGMDSVLGIDADSPYEVKRIDDHDSKGRTVRVEFAGTEFDNVSVIEVSTGGNVVPGRHRISLERIEFRGKLVSAGTLRLVIIAVWVLAVIGYLLLDGVLARRQLRLSSLHQSSLKRINDGLRMRTDIYSKLARQDLLTGVLNRKGLGDELLRVARGGDDRLFPLSL